MRHPSLSFPVRFYAQLSLFFYRFDAHRSKNNEDASKIRSPVLVLVLVVAVVVIVVCVAIERMMMK